MARTQLSMTRARWAAVGAVIVAGAFAYACGGSVSTSAAGDAGPTCTASSDCADGQFCNEPGCDGGTCEPIPTICPGLYEPICGCNRESYSNDCLAHWGNQGPITSVAYGGDCRVNPIVECTSSSGCSSNQVCALDPRTPCDGGASCVGFCATASAAGNGIEPCNVPGNCGSTNTSTCLVAACDGGAWSCDYCAYTSGLRCDAGNDCPSGQLCTPPASCGGTETCAGYCVVP